jgi:hypothetical protein
VPQGLGLIHGWSNRSIKVCLAAHLSDVYPLYLYRSAHREPSFGHGILVVTNATHAVWQWHRNQDAADVISDETFIVRKEDCLSRAPTPLPSIAKAPAPIGQPPVESPPPSVVASSPNPQPVVATGG